MSRINFLLVICILIISAAIVGCSSSEKQVVSIFDDAKDFSEGLAAVKVNGQWGYIDSTGKMIIDPVYDEAFNFNRGTALVAIEDKKGMINKDGRVIIELIYELVYTAIEYEDYFVVKSETGFGIIYRDEDLSIEPKYDSIRVLAPDLFVASIDGKDRLINPRNNFEKKFVLIDSVVDDRTRFFDGEKWGFIDSLGQKAIPAIYDKANNFINGHAFVKNEEFSGLINIEGEIILQLDAYDFLGFYNGRGFIYKNDKWGMIDRNGEIVVDPKFDLITPFSDGIAAVAIMGEGAGYIDMNGQPLTGLEFQITLPFKAEHGIVLVNEKYGLVNIEDDIVVEPIYDRLNLVKESLFQVTKAGKIGVIDIKKNKMIIEVIHDRVTLNEGVNIFTLEKDGTRGFVDVEGNSIIDFLPINAVHQRFYEGLLGKKEGDLWGYVNVRGEFVIQPIYKNVGSFSERHAKVNINGGWIFIDKSGDRMMNE
ncbi:MAG: WG repeat-containing protein [Alkaliphilus sp.]